MNLDRKTILIVGLGKTGEALADFLLKKGARVRITEKKRKEDLGRRAKALEKRGVDIEGSGHRPDSFLQSDLILLSPGVRPNLLELQLSRNRGIRIISEIELAHHFLKGKIIGITGSNGKSTTACLTHQILRQGGLKSHLAGNIGVPLISFVEKSRADDIYVTEISSFQLHDIEDFRAPVSIFLNVSPNHLDWHSSFEEYYATKQKLVLGQGRGDTAILNRDDPLVWALREKGEYLSLPFSRKKKLSSGACLENDRVVLHEQETQTLVRRKEIRLPGDHNLDNVMAASLAGRLFGVSIPNIRRAIRNFKGLEHRLEKVLCLRGVEFINDSKATSVEATIHALRSFQRPVVLILGGRDKGDDFTRLRKFVRTGVRKVILIGEAGQRIRKELTGAAEAENAGSLKEAVSLGFAAAGKSGIVLLSPACSSFDMFDDFEHRGRAFKKEVSHLAARLKKGKI